MSTKKREHHHADHASEKRGPDNAIAPVRNVSAEERSRSIQIRAFGLWEQAGKPDGDAAREHFWYEAEKVIMADHMAIR